ncbi:MAG: hypothetical protein IIT39_12665 [Clostridia bacterium]|nr:hypothetical protein [Clostridia bacterium]
MAEQARTEPPHNRDFCLLKVNSPPRYTSGTQSPKCRVRDDSNMDGTAELTKPNTAQNP